MNGLILSSSSIMIFLNSENLRLPMTALLTPCSYTGFSFFSTMSIKVVVEITVVSTCSIVLL